MKVIMLDMSHRKLQAEEIAGVVQVGLRRFLGEKPAQARQVVRQLRSEVGIEIGGSSSFFAGLDCRPSTRSWDGSMMLISARRPSEKGPSKRG